MLRRTPSHRIWLAAVAMGLALSGWSANPACADFVCDFEDPGDPLCTGDGVEWKNEGGSPTLTGAVWLTSDNRSAVVFVGTKGQGKCWYGFANGVVWPEGGPYPPVPPYPNDQRGWWSTSFAAQILSYDPADLAAVAKGKGQTPPPAAIRCNGHR